MGCACTATSGEHVNCGDLINNKLKRETVAKTSYISAYDFRRGDLKTIMRFAYCANEKGFQKAFEDVFDRPVTSEDIPNLVRLHKEGIDKKHGFSIIKKFSTINVNTKSLANCGVKFVNG